MDPRFDTARLHLRPLAGTDLDDLLALDSDPAVMRFINGGVPSTLADYEGGLLERMLAYRGQPFGFFAALDTTDLARPFIGWFHLRPSVADAAILELGYRLRRTHWGRGLATEGALVLRDHALQTLDEPAVDACALPDNAASIAVMRKCGMRYAGRFVHPRAKVEVVRYLVERER